jgi:hypothetical protein
MDIITKLATLDIKSIFAQVFVTTGRGPIIDNLHVTRERMQIFLPFFADDNIKW